MNLNLNLTEPPEVDEPSARRLDELRSALVEYARQDLRPKQRRAWVPVAAAVGAVAAIAAAVVVVPRLTSADPAPADTNSPPSPHATIGSPPGPTPLTPSTPVRVTPPIPPSPRAGTVTGDLGPASQADARTMLDRCFQSPGQVAFRRQDRATATIEWARWMRTAAWFGPGSTWTVKQDRQLVVSVRRADGLAWALCVDDRHGYPGQQIVSGWDGVSASNRNPGLSANRPFVNSASFGSGSTSDGRWLLKYGTSFDLIAKVARVDIRLTWPGGASQWQHAAVHSANGYAEVTAIGTGPKPADRDVKVEVRLTDASGHVFARLAGPTGAPLSVVR
jgi:hypothetical protein